MRPHILIALAIVTLAMPAAAQTQLLPEDADRPLIMIVDNDHSPAADRVQAMLQSPPMRQFTAGAHLHRFRPNSPLYQSLHAPTLGTSPLPILAVAAADGGVIYKASGDGIPTDPVVLRDQIAALAQIDRGQDCPGGQCPLPTPSPSPSPAPSPFGFDRFPNLIPDSATVAPQVNLPEVSWIIPAALVGLSLAIVTDIALVAGAVYFFLRD